MSQGYRVTRTAAGPNVGYQYTIKGQTVARFAGPNPNYALGFGDGLLPDRGAQGLDPLVMAVNPSAATTLNSHISPPAPTWRGQNQTAAETPPAPVGEPAPIVEPAGAPAASGAPPPPPPPPVVERPAFRCVPAIHPPALDVEPWSVGEEFAPNAFSPSTGTSGSTPASDTGLPPGGYTPSNSSAGFATPTSGTSSTVSPMQVGAAAVEQVMEAAHVAAPKTSAIPPTEGITTGGGTTSDSRGMLDLLYNGTGSKPPLETSPSYNQTFRPVPLGTPLTFTSMTQMMQAPQESTGGMTFGSSVKPPVFTQAITQPSTFSSVVQQSWDQPFGAAPAPTPSYALSGIGTQAAVAPATSVAYGSGPAPPPPPPPPPPPQVVRGVGPPPPPPPPPPPGPGKTAKVWKTHGVTYDAARELGSVGASKIEELRIAKGVDQEMYDREDVDALDDGSPMEISRQVPAANRARTVPAAANAQDEIKRMIEGGGFKLRKRPVAGGEFRPGVDTLSYSGSTSTGLQQNTGFALPGASDAVQVQLSIDARLAAARKNKTPVKGDIAAEMAAALSKRRMGIASDDELTPSPESSSDAEWGTVKKKRTPDQLVPSDKPLPRRVAKNESFVLKKPPKPVTPKPSGGGKWGSKGKGKA